MLQLPPGPIILLLTEGRQCPFIMHRTNIFPKITKKDLIAGGKIMKKVAKQWRSECSKEMEEQVLKDLFEVLKELNEDSESTL